MAGGKFDVMAGKVRPGTYINFESNRQGSISSGTRGVVLLPLIGHDYGPQQEFLTLTAAAPDAAYEKLGYSVNDSNANMLLIREAMKNASKVIVCIPKEGAKATGAAAPLTGTAKYGGSRGNALCFTVVANPIAGFDVTIYLDNAVVNSYEGLTTVEQLTAMGCPWIDFTGTGNLVAAAGVTLTGGTDATVTNADITALLDAAEGQVWNTMAFPLAPTGTEGDTTQALLEAVKSKIKYLREETGKYRKAVVSGLAADYEGIINVTNGVVLSDGTEVTAAQATAWTAGADAGADYVTSNTYKVYDGAVDILGPKTHAEAVAAINNGEFFFSFAEAGQVIVEYDINSLVSFDKPKDNTYRKNRVLRVFDSFGDTLMLTFPPNKYDNSPQEWDVMEGIGKQMLKTMEAEGAIKNVDYDADFLVDRTLSDGDHTYFNCGLQAVDSAEKLYFTVQTR